MRIDRLQIDGFGLFHRRDIGPFEATLAVIAGANEAGKSTLLAFIRTVLFGFPRQRSDQWYPPLAGGNHGGSVVFIADDGQEYTVRRYRGPRGGKVTLNDADGSQLDGTDLARILDHAPRDLFESVFAFSLDELQEPRSLEGDEVSGRIYSAGIGAASLPAALRELDASQKQIFAPGGRKHRIAQVLRDLQEVEAKLGEVSAFAAEYGVLTARQVETERKLDAIAQERAALQSRLRELARLRSGWGEWGQMLDIDARMAELPRFTNFPEDATVRLNGLHERVREAEQAVSEAEVDYRRVDEAANAEIKDEALLEESEIIERVRRGRSSFDASVRDLPEREAELRQYDDALRNGLRSLGPDWDEQRLQEFDTSVALRDQVEQWQLRLAEAERLTRESEGELKRRQDDVSEAVEAEREANAVLEAMTNPPLTAAELESQRGALRSARGHLDAFARAQDRRTDLEAQLEQSAGELEDATRWEDRWPVLPVLVALGGLAALVAGLAVDGQGVAIFLGGVLLFVGAAAYGMQVAKRRAAGPPQPARTGALRRLVQEAREAEVRAGAALTADVGNFGIDGIEAVDETSLGEVERRLDAAAEALGTWNSAVQGLAEATKQVDRCQRRAEGAESERGAASREEEFRRAEWVSWLRERQLAETLTPITVGQVLERVETARAEQRQVKAWRQRVRAIKDDIEEYHDLVGPLAGRHLPGGAPLEPGRTQVIADDLIAHYESARAGVARRDSYKGAAKTAQQNVERRQRRLRSRQSDLEALISAGGASDAEDLRRRDKQHTERRELDGDRRGYLRALQQLCASDQSVEGLIEAIKQTTPESVGQEWETLEENLGHTEERRSALDEERGRIESSLERLTSEEESSALRAHREVLVEQLQAHAREWSKLAIAQAILQRARQKYERERKPGVMRHAERFFKTVTGNRYSHLYAPLGEQTITIASRDGATRQPTELSRGTREQLYLALRFGLIRELGDHVERLPVIVDEVLVNFDPQRARRAAEALVEMSETNQVLVFTCHPSTVELFMTAAPDAQVIDLDADPSRPSADTQVRLI